MKSNNYLRLALLTIISSGVLTLSGCGITIATVAGVAAYNVSQSTPDSAALAKKLTSQIRDSYFAIAIQDKTMILAGQVPSTADINKAKILIAKDYSDTTVYTYVIVAPAESESAQEADKLLDTQTTKLMTSNKTTGVTTTSSNGSVYLLTNEKTSSKSLEQLSDNILKLAGVKTIITIHSKPSK